MKNCICCGARCAPDALSCLACGEASWSPSHAQETNQILSGAIKSLSDITSAALSSITTADPEIPETDLAPETPDNSGSPIPFDPPTVVDVPRGRRSSRRS